MNATIQWCEKWGKWAGYVDGRRVVDRVSRDLVAVHLKEKFGVVVDAGEVSETVPAVAVKKDAPSFHINERFDFLQHFVSMIAKKKSTALIVSGPGGLGKSHTVFETLKRNGLVEDTIGEMDGDYIVVKGFTTAKAMFRTLWENNGKVIVFDDADSSFKDAVGVNILKGALDSNEKRVISWNAEFRDSEEMPNRFEFTGRVIFISNLAMDQIPQALQSRASRVSLAMTTDEKVARIETIMMEKSFMPKIDGSIKHDVITFIKKHAHDFTDLSMRSAVKITELRDTIDDVTKFNRMALYTATA